MKLLLTSFGPFGSESVNPAEQAISLVPAAVGSLEITKCILPVDAPIVQCDPTDSLSTLPIKAMEAVIRAAGLSARGISAAIGAARAALNANQAGAQ